MSVLRVTLKWWTPLLDVFFPFRLVHLRELTAFAELVTMAMASVFALTESSTWTVAGGDLASHNLDTALE